MEKFCDGVFGFGLIFMNFGIKRSYIQYSKSILLF